MMISSEGKGLFRTALGNVPRRFLKRAPMVAVLASIITACTDTSGRVKDVFDTRDTASPVHDTADTGDTDDTSDTGEELEITGYSYVWQLGAETDDDADGDPDDELDTVPLYENPEEVAEGLSFESAIITTSDQYLEWLLDVFNATAEGEDTGDTGAPDGEDEYTGLRLTPQLAKWSDYYDTETGLFDYDAWEQVIEQYRGLDLSESIGKSFAGVVILDDLGDFADEGPDSKTLDQMAGKIKEVLNISDDVYFPLIVRHDATDMLLKHNDHEFEHVTHVYVQISEVKATDGLRAFIEAQVAAAEELGLQIIWGVNLLDWELAEDYDGVCPSGHNGFREGRCVITPDELLEVVSLLEEVSGDGVGVWKVSKDFYYIYTDPDYVNAVGSLLDLAA